MSLPAARVVLLLLVAYLIHDATSMGIESSSSLCRITNTEQLLESVHCTSLLASSGNFAANDTQQEQLRAVLVGSQDVHHITLWRSQISDEFADILAEAIAHPQSGIDFLDLSHADISPTALNRILQAASKSASLTTISLVSVGLTSDHARSLASVLTAVTPLELLNMNGNALRVLDVCTIATALKSNTRLQVLDMSGSHIADDAAACLGSALSSNNALQTLYLYHCRVTTEGAKSLAQGISSGSSGLLHLFMVDNAEITAEAATALADVLLSEHTSSLEQIELGRCSVGNDGAKSLADVIAVNVQSLNHLGLAANQIDDGGVEYLASALRVNTHLTTLDLSYNLITERGLALLVDALDSNPKSRVSKLLMRNNLLKPEVLQTFNDFMLSVKTRIEALDSPTTRRLRQVDEASNQQTQAASQPIPSDEQPASVPTSEFYDSDVATAEQLALDSQPNAAAALHPNAGMEGDQYCVDGSGDCGSSDTGRIDASASQSVVAQASQPQARVMYLASHGGEMELEDMQDELVVLLASLHLERLIPVASSLGLTAKVHFFSLTQPQWDAFGLSDAEATKLRNAIAAMQSVAMPPTNHHFE